jgi:hypothetical protein
MLIHLHTGRFFARLCALCEELHNAIDSEIAPKLVKKLVCVFDETKHSLIGGNVVCLSGLHVRTGRI